MTVTPSDVNASEMDLAVDAAAHQDFGAEAAELMKKLKACMNPEHNPSRYLRTHGVLTGVLTGYS